MKGITSIAHAAVRVKDIDRSLDFYVGKLGFDEMFRLYRDDGSLWIVYLRITDDQYVELFPDGIGERAPVPETIGHNHFCLAVDDMDKVWVSDWPANAIQRFDPVTEKFEIFASDRARADVRQILGRAGEVWAAESGTDRLVVIRD